MLVKPVIIARRYGYAYVDDQIQEEINTMTIGSAVQKGTYVIAYDEKGHQIFSLPSGAKPEDGLKGYTGSTLSIRKGGYVFTYNDKGRQISSTPVR